MTDLQYLPLDLPGLRHAISTRHGGVSNGPYATLNLGYHVGDNPASVTENRRRLGEMAGYDPTKLITARQVHGTRLAWVGKAECGRGAFDWESALPDTDGLLTAQAETPVAILVADCAPVLIADPVTRRLALVHAGWRGAFGRIASGAVHALAAAGSRPEDLYAGIGPTLCTACLEVSPEIGQQVTDEFGEASVDRKEVKPHLRIREMLIADLAGAGVSPARITVHPACTRCRTDLFFSHRSQAGVAGRFMLVAWWE